ncbi:hypothetical protein AVEN_118957-1, partial [Araneus ventricosus]
CKMRNVFQNLLSALNFMFIDRLQVTFLPQFYQGRVCKYASRGKKPARGQGWEDQGPSKKKKIRPTKRYDSSSDSSDYYDPPLMDSDDDVNLDINDGDKPDSRKATCIFCDGKFSEDTRGEEWVKCVMCQMWAHLDCAGAETASYVCDFC